MQKILIVGGSHSELSLAQEAKKLGLYTITVGNILGNAHLEADEYHLLDYSDKESILEFAKQNSIDHICFGAHDLSMTTTSYVAQHLNFDIYDNYETTLNLHHKDRFKAISQQHSINTPKSISITLDDNISDISKLKMPLIIKPVDMGGGKGITVIKDTKQLTKAINDAFSYSKIKKVIIEEFFEGSLHSLSTWIVDKKVVFHHTDDEFECPNNPYGVCISLAPASNFGLIKGKLINEVEKISNVFKLKNGLLHIQYLQNKDDFTIVECTRRMPGDLYNIPVEMKTTFPYAKNIILNAIEQKPILTYETNHKIVSRYCVIDSYPNSIEPYIVDRVQIKNANKKEILFLEFKSKKDFFATQTKLNMGGFD